jgi:hypothetical protein
MMSTVNLNNVKDEMRLALPDVFADLRTYLVVISSSLKGFMSPIKRFMSSVFW